MAYNDSFDPGSNYQSLVVNEEGFWIWEDGVNG
jgi:hypothetical protein